MSKRNLIVLGYLFFSVFIFGLSMTHSANYYWMKGGEQFVGTAHHAFPVAGMTAGLLFTGLIPLLIFVWEPPK